MVKNDKSNKSSLLENEYYVQSNQHVTKLRPHSRLDWLGKCPKWKAEDELTGINDGRKA